MQRTADAGDQFSTATMSHLLSAYCVLGGARPLLRTGVMMWTQDPSTADVALQVRGVSPQKATL